MTKLKTGIIIGSTREGRFAEKPAAWIYELARQRDELDVELVDLRDYPMPFFDEAASPIYGSPGNEHAQRWGKKIASLDGFIFTVAEYNRGPTAVLKNALDYAYREWNNKPAAFVGYGGAGAARAMEQLRLHAIELQMAPIRTGVHILLPDYMAIHTGEKPLAAIEHLNQGAGAMLDQFVWWAKALKAARNETAAEPKAA
ncbi:NADPH-dependent FMN reductase [Nitratireductor sp. GCM10026969]|uniref:NADPH-dependent FMN reductase n=1 Tax=Nitratireductor sp. GCM10026969 TaxID=3252645 RepID=UPI0036179E50